MNKSLWICLLSMIAVTACMPVQVTYLRPSAPGATYERSECGGREEPKDRAVLLGPRDYVIRAESYYLEHVNDKNRWNQRDSEK